MEVEKECFKCSLTKPLTEYYKHKGMSDGYLGKCKDCTKKDTKDRADVLNENSDWRKTEKARHRDKYHRLGYKDKYKEEAGKGYERTKKSRIKYPEKYEAHKMSQKLIKSNPNNHNHHWSYNESHRKDCIEMSEQEHGFLHRYLKYNQPEMMYEDLDGNLLDTRQKHIDYFEMCKIKYNFDEERKRIDGYKK